VFFFFFKDLDKNIIIKKKNTGVTLDSSTALYNK